MRTADDDRRRRRRRRQRVLAPMDGLQGSGSSCQLQMRSFQGLRSRSHHNGESYDVRRVRKGATGVRLRAAERAGRHGAGREKAR